jgi:hypothetical protein
LRTTDQKYNRCWKLSRGSERIVSSLSKGWDE